MTAIAQLAILQAKTAQSHTNHIQITYKSHTPDSIRTGAIPTFYYNETILTSASEINYSKSNPNILLE